MQVPQVQKVLQYVNQVYHTYGILWITIHQARILTIQQMRMVVIQ